MKIIVKSCGMALSLAVLATAVQAADTTAPSASFVRTQTDPCPNGLERFLPGDYYFCAATQAYWKGRPEDASRLLADAARWGNKTAQYALGVMYFNGDGAPVNRPLGLAWLALSAERHDPRNEQLFVSAYNSASPAERDQANTLWHSMKPQFADETAARRALAQFHRAMRPVSTGTDINGSIFIDGVTASSYIEGVRPNMSFNYTAQRELERRAAAYFQGYSTKVTVGDAAMITVDDASNRLASNP